MTTCYKATRLEGTDFHTGKILYEVGKRVRPAPHSGEARICGPGYLHAADAPAETLVGGGWPCRLFEVTGRPAVGFDNKHPHKGGFHQLTVIRELDAHLALGPNGVEVAALIDRAGMLTVGEAQGLRASREAANVAAWAAAWAAARAAGWAAARDAAWEAAFVAAWDAARAAAWDAAWGGAWAAARDAAGALVVRGLITAAQFDALYGTWKSVIG